VPVWAYDLACGFWRTLGAEEGFPRTFDQVWMLPVTVTRLPGLTLSSVRAWLAAVGVRVEARPDRALCGCMVAARGSAFVFVDAEDAADEQRYTLAHELAHYLRDVWRPRERVERLLGPAGTEVWDGERMPTQEERLAAAIEGVDLAVRVQFLTRDGEGRPATASIAMAEESADVLAFELLAPAARLAADGEARWMKEELIERLRGEYGLPRREAMRYAERLRPVPRRVEGWVTALRG
jgi:hypothetical protein